MRLVVVMVWRRFHWAVIADVLCRFHYQQVVSWKDVGRMKTIIDIESVAQSLP